MLARGHAISGAAGWLGLCAAASAWTDFDPTPLHIGAGVVVATGAAIFNDIDHTGSRVARTLGPVTWIIARVFTFIADLVRDATCSHCDTPGTHGHRTLSHTAVFAILSGAGVSLAGHYGGLVAAAIVVGVGAALAVAGLTGSRVGTVLVGVAAGYATYRLGAGVDWRWLGAPVGAGLLLHVAGDLLTEGGVPVAAPIKIGRCRWYRIRLPKWIAIKTGGWAEGLVSVAMFGGGVFAAWVLLTS